MTEKCNIGPGIPVGSGHCYTHGITWQRGSIDLPALCPVAEAREAAWLDGARAGLEAGDAFWLNRENELRLSGLSGFADELWRTRTQRPLALDPEVLRKEVGDGE